MRTLQQSLASSTAAATGQLSTKDRADLANGLAWFGEDARTLRATRGWRGQVTHVSQRFLRYDVAPSLAATPSTARADAAFAPGGIARELLGLDTDESVSFQLSFAQRGGARRFVYRQFWSGVPVYGAVATLDLDSTGRMTRLDSTVVPFVAPAGGALISSATALSTARSHVLSLGAPWTGATVIALETEHVILARHTVGGPDVDRYAWRFLLTASGRVGALREVLVDRITNTVLSSTDEMRYAINVVQATGSIGGPDLMHTTTSLSEACVGPSSALTGANPLLRDADEVSEAACEAQGMLASVGASFGHPLVGDWLGTSDIAIGIGATPLLSIGANNRGARRITFALGNGRLESVGHELFHSVLASRTVTSFTWGIGSHVSAEGAAIEEHLCDAFGLVLERRFAARREDDCLLADDADTRATIQAQNVSSLRDATTNPTLPYRPCADLALNRPWRSVCAPRADNGGWCEGADRYRDLAYSKYDAYGRTDTRTSNFIASHTNLGLGNRALLTLLGETPGSPYVVEGLSDADVERLAVGAPTVLSAGTDWARYGMSMSDLARSLGGGPGISSLERQVRVVLANAQIWTVPELIMPALTSGGTATTLAPSPDWSVGVSSLALTGALAGRERTFAFFRGVGASAPIQYVWRDDVAGGGGATLGNGWIGPCSIAGTAAVTGVSAATTGDGLFLAWTEATPTAGVGRLRGLRITGESATGVTSGCGHTFVANDPPVERLVRGTPSIAQWSASQWLTICEELAGLIGDHFPFRTVGAMGLQIGDCVDIAERFPGFPRESLLPQLGPTLLEALRAELDSQPAISLPQPGDPFAPRLPLGASDFAATIPLLAQIRGNQQLIGQLSQLPAPIGPRFQRAFSRYGLPTGMSIDAILDQTAIARGGDGIPEGPIETVSYRFRENVLVVAFRAPDGTLRATTWDSTNPSASLAVLATAPSTDAVLTQATVNTDDGAGARVRVNFLYAVYGTTVTGSAPRLSYSVARTFDPLMGVTATTFDASRPLDDVIDTAGVRRRRDYRFLRSRFTPAATGGVDSLHVITVGLAQPEVPSDAATVVDESASTEARLRYAAFRVKVDGTLAPSSERPVRLAETNLTSASAGTAGALAPLSARQRIWFFYPNGGGLSVRSEREFR